MAKIDHINRRFFLRILLSPFAIIFWLFKFFSCKGEVKKYLLGSSNLSTEDRYEKFFSFFKADLFLKQVKYTFLYDSKLLQTQAIFVVDSNLDWKSITVLKYVHEKHGNKFPSFILYSELIRSKPSSMWDLIDTYYGEKDVSLAIDSRRSFFVEKRMICESELCASLVKQSYLPIIPIHVFEKDKKIFYRFGDLVKASDLMKIRNISFSSMIENSFESLKGKFLEDIRANSRKSKDN